jgi:hypothetical protein
MTQLLELQKGTLLETSMTRQKLAEEKLMK